LGSWNFGYDTVGFPARLVTEVLGLAFGLLVERQWRRDLERRVSAFSVAVRKMTDAAVVEGRRRELVR
jgi:hypothetical protein